MNYCPVCGYPGFKEPVDIGDLCPSCGTEFGFNDEFVTHKELRNRWIQTGMHWWSRTRSVPAQWAPVKQLAQLIGTDLPMPKIVHLTTKNECIGIGIAPTTSEIKIGKTTFLKTETDPEGTMYTVANLSMRGGGVLCLA